MRILLTNDDGIEAEGILTLAEMLKKDHEIYISAPWTQKSGYSHACTYYYGQRRAEERMIEGVKSAWAVEGTPADCVYYGLYAFFDQKPDLVISGVNHGENLSADVFYSGTIGAAEESLIAGIPSMAVSLCTFESYDFTASVKIAEEMIPMYMNDPHKKEYILSLNVPPVPYAEVKGYKVCGLQSGRTYEKNVIKLPQEDGTFLLKADNSQSHQQKYEGMYGDDMAVKDGYVSVTPISLNPVKDERILDLTKMIEKNH